MSAHSNRYEGDLEEMRDLWARLLGSPVTDNELLWWLGKYGARDTCRAIRRTFAAYTKRGGAMDLNYQTKYCSTVARNFAETNTQSEGTRRKHNYPYVQDGAQ